MARAAYHIPDQVHDEVRQLCRDIHKRSDNRQQLETLVIRLQQALHPQPKQPRPIHHSPNGEDPFDKIIA